MDSKKDTKKITLLYFQICPKNVGTGFSKLDIQKALERLHEIEFDTHEMPTKSISLYGEIVKRNDYFLGTAIHNKLTGIDPKFNHKTRELSGLNLDLTEGLAKATHFLIDPKANVLVIENVSNGVQAGALCNYLKKFLGTRPLDPALLINPRQLEHFYNMTHIVKFQVKIAKVEEGGILHSGNKKSEQSINQVTRLADNTNADTVNLTLEMNPESKSIRKSLNKAKIANFITGFLNHKDSGEIEQLRAYGMTDDDDGIIPLDFIKEKLMDFILVEKEEKNISKFDSERHFQEIESVYSKRREEIYNTYRF